LSSYACRVTLLARVFAVNAAVVVGATVLLVSTPATVSFPVAVTEATVLCLGLLGALAVNLVVLRRLFRPLVRLTGLMRQVDPLRPGTRLVADGATREVEELTTAFNEMLERVETERRESARRALAAETHERRRIARDLHDEVGQMLTVAMLDLDAAVRSGDRAVIERAREEIRTSAEEVRRIARRVRPELLDDLGLPSALRSLAARVGRDSSVEVERRIDSGLPELTEDEELVLYRVAQEALTNAARHGGASRVELRLGACDGGVELSVEDDGHGFDASRSPEGDGIRGMRERALLIGADLRIRSSPGAGTGVELRVTS
jgi:two-component system, NarL family, sensor histidine kinase UhpB